MTMVTLTKNEAIDLQDLIEDYLFKIIRTDDSIDSMHWLTNIVNIWKKCDEGVLKEAKPTELEKKVQNLAKLIEKTENDFDLDLGDHPMPEPEEPAAPSAPSFFGQQAALKRSVYERLQACRAKGMSSVEISKLTKGKVTPDEVMEILAGTKIPFIKWKALDGVLEGKQEEAS